MCIRDRYFAERDLDGVLARMTDDVEWIGTGRQDGCRGIREARKMLEMERRVFHGSFSLEAVSYTHLQPDGARL